MKKIYVVSILVFALVAGVLLWLGGGRGANTVTGTDYKNISYVVDEQTVTLKDGVSRVPAVGDSGAEIVTRYFGNEARGDVNADGLDDVAFLLTQNGGGTGTFYYAVVALKTATGYAGTNAVFLGDRIAPQNTRIQNGIITVNYADRGQGEPFTTPPSVGVSKYFRVSGKELIAEESSEKITYVNASRDMIVPELPFPGAVVGKTFSVIGKARGTWFFEASFPVEVRGADGNVLVQTHADAKSDWMTADFVPFQVSVTVPQTYIGPATLVLHKDNPSGLPEHDASISFPITIEY